MPSSSLQDLFRKYGFDGSRQTHPDPQPEKKKREKAYSSWSSLKNKFTTLDLVLMGILFLGIILLIGMGIDMVLKGSSRTNRQLSTSGDLIIPLETPATQNTYNSEHCNLLLESWTKKFEHLKDSQHNDLISIIKDNTLDSNIVLLDTIRDAIYNLNEYGQNSDLRVDFTRTLNNKVCSDQIEQTNNQILNFIKTYLPKN